MRNFGKAWKAFWAILSGKEYVEQIEIEEAQEPELQQEEKEVTASVEAQSNGTFEDGAVFALSLLQRESRLIDFLQEDIAGFADAQIGAAVRQIHTNSRKVLEDYFSLEPVLGSPEGQPTIVPADYDPSEIRLTGTFASEGPFNGTLQHKGWKAAAVKLPQRTGAVNPAIVYPAEVSTN